MVEVDLEVLIVSLELSVLVDDSLLIIDLALLVIDQLFLVSDFLSQKIHILTLGLDEGRKVVDLLGESNDLFLVRSGLARDSNIGLLELNLFVSESLDLESEIIDLGLVVAQFDLVLFSLFGLEIF